MKTQLRTPVVERTSRRRSTLRIFLPSALLALLSFQPSAGTDLAGVWRDVDAGRQLSLEDVANLEDVLLGDPYANGARVRLIGYHWHRQWTDRDSRRRHNDLTLWMVRNAPRHPVFRMAYGRIDQGVSPESFEQAKKRGSHISPRGPRTSCCSATPRSFSARTTGDSRRRC